MDKKLLELAAKAAGIELAWIQINEDGKNRDSKKYWYDKQTGFSWNPLTDDGDALRLAVKLGLQVSERVAEVWRDGKETAYFFEDEGDPYAATRRSIVRAAAEIGKTL